MARASIEIIADSSQVKTATQDLRGLAAQGGKTEKSVNALRVAFSALTAVGASAFFKSIVSEQEQVQRNMLRTEAVIKATGAAAGFTAARLRDQAKELARATLQSTEGVQRAQTLLLSYSNITGDVFSRAIEAAADLSTLVGGELNASIEGLAKVLDDPIEGINALSRQGIRFSKDQKTMIASLVETNRLAEAQTIILDELAGQFGGIARKEAEGLTGAIDTLGQNFQEFKLALAETTGAAELTLKAVNTVADAAAFLRDNAAAATKGLGAGAAVLTALYIPALYRVVAAKVAVTSASVIMARTIALATGPFGALALAVGAAAAAFGVYKNEADALKQAELEQTQRVKQLAEEYSKYSKARLGTEAMAIQREAIKVDQELAEKKRRLTEVEYDYIDAVNGRVQSSAKERRQAAALKAEIAELEARQKGLALQTKAVTDAFDNGLPPINNAIERAIKSTRKLDNNYESLQRRLVDQIVELRLSADAYEQYAAAQSIGADATVAERQHVERLIAQLQILRGERKAAEEAEQVGRQFSGLQSELAAQDNPAEQARQQLQARLDVIREYAALEGADRDAARKAQLDAERIYQDQLLEIEARGSDRSGFFGAITESLGGLQNQISGTFAQMALGFGDGEEMTKRLAATIITDLTGAMINYGIQQALVSSGLIASKGAEAAAVKGAIAAETSAAVIAQGTLTTAASTSGGAIATAMAPAAAATSIATGGAAPAAAAPIALGTIAAIVAALVGGIALFGRATGGQVLGGRPYLVGERGPELFTPNSSGGGRVTPFSQLMSQQSDSQVSSTNANITFVMPEGDGDFVQRLSENRDMIYNIVQQALAERGRAF